MAEGRNFKTKVQEMLSSRRTVLWAVVMGVLAVNSTAFGRRGCSDVTTVEVPLPGVDEFGNVSTDESVAGEGLAKIYLSRKSRCVTVVARGSVGNESGSRQCYRNLLPSGEFGDYESEGISIRSDRYNVSRGGSAFYCGYGKVEQSDL